MKTKKLSELERGDRVKLVDPDGTARVTRVGSDFGMAQLARTAEGKAIEVEWKIISGPNSGQKGGYMGSRSDEVKMV